MRIDRCETEVELLAALDPIRKGTEQRRRINLTNSLFFLSILAALDLLCEGAEQH